MTHLYEVAEYRIYCGPASIMAVSGRNFKEVRAAINVVRGFKENQGVRRVSGAHLEGALGILGINYTASKVSKQLRLTVIQFALNVAEPTAIYIVTTREHAFAMQDGLIIDNQYRFGVRVESGCRHNLKHVTSFYKINC